MNTKTLKEAYESVGETLKVGDIIERWAWRQTVQSVDGWYFTDKNEDSDMCDSADTIEGCWFKRIERDGKQIYPKLDDSKKCDLYRALERDGAIRNINDIVECVTALIDAKIKESK